VTQTEWGPRCGNSRTPGHGRTHLPWTDENETHPGNSSKIGQKLGAFGALLDLVSRKVTTLVEAIVDRDPRVPALNAQLRGALDVLQASIADVRKTIDPLDGGRR
jgi:hypothetical protein